MNFMLSFVAMAQPGAEGQGGGFGLFLPMILIFVIFYFLILRPQSKRQREHQKMLDVLQKGDRIVTTGGIHGVIVKITEGQPTMTIKIGDDVKVEIDRHAVARKMTLAE